MRVDTAASTPERPAALESAAAVPGLSDPLLTKRLREMEAMRLVERRVLPTSPVRVQYSLTEAGRDLERAVRVISEWAGRWWRYVEPASRAARSGPGKAGAASPRGDSSRRR